MPSCLRPMRAPGEGGVARESAKAGADRTPAAPCPSPGGARPCPRELVERIHGQVPSENLHPLLKDLSLYWSAAMIDENAGRASATCQSSRQSRAIRDLSHVWHDTTPVSVRSRSILVTAI